MQQVVYKQTPGRNRYYGASAPKCNGCNRTLKVGESIIKLNGNDYGVHRSCLEDWLIETPWQGEGARAEMDKAKTEAEFQKLRRKLMRQMREERKDECEEQSGSST